MFGIGLMEFVVIAIAVLVFVGPQKLPQLMKQAGRFFVHMRRTATEVRGTFDGVVRDAEAEMRREEFDRIKDAMDEARDAVQAPLQAEEYNPDHHDGQHHHDEDHDHNHYPEHDPHHHGEEQTTPPVETTPSEPADKKD